MLDEHKVLSFEHRLCCVVVRNDTTLCKVLGSTSTTALAFISC